jgi:hypothetical protein
VIGRITLSRDAGHHDAIAPEPGQVIEGEFYARVMLRDLPREEVPDPEFEGEEDAPKIFGSPIKLTKATFAVDGKKPQVFKNPKHSDWLSAEEIETLQEGPSGIIEFDKPFTSTGKHELSVKIEFEDGEVYETKAEIAPPPPEVQAEPHPAVTLLQGLGAKSATLDVAARLLRDEPADTDEIEGALADIGKISEKDLSLFELRTLAGLAQGMRGGVSNVAIARSQLRKAVEGNA